MTALHRALGAAALAVAFAAPTAAAEQQVAYNPGAPWAVVTLADGCVVAVSALMDEWADGPGTFAWSGKCSAGGFIEGPGTLSRKYKGRAEKFEGGYELFDREWHMHAAAVNGLMHGVGEKSYGTAERVEYKFVYGCSLDPDGAGGWTPPIANCSPEDGEMIAQEIAKAGGPATFEMFRKLVEQQQ